MAFVDYDLLAYHVFLVSSLIATLISNKADHMVVLGKGQGVL